MDRLATMAWVPGVPVGVWLTFGQRWAGVALAMATVAVSAGATWSRAR